MEGPSSSSHGLPLYGSVSVSDPPSLLPLPGEFQAFGTVLSAALREQQARSRVRGRGKEAGLGGLGLVESL